MSAYQTRHARAVAYMLLSVLCFAANDTITKQLTASMSILPVLAMRAACAAALIYASCLVFKVKIDSSLFRSPLLYAKTVLFIATIAAFAISFKYNDFVEFYAVFLIFIQLFAVLIDLYVYKIKPSKLLIIPMLILVLGAALALKSTLGSRSAEGIEVNVETAFLTSLLPISTAFFYALYIAFSNYINRKLVLDSFSQNIPMLSIGCVILLLLGLSDKSSIVEIIGVLGSLNSVARIVLSACLSVVGIISLTQATRFDNASSIAPYEFIVIVYAVFIDRMFFGKTVDAYGYVGALMILAGAAMFSKIKGDSERSRAV